MVHLKTIDTIFIEPPYDKLTYCNKGNDNGMKHCNEKTNGKFDFCWKLNFVGDCLINGEEEDECDGVCISKDVSCNSNDDCKDIGSIRSGSLHSLCIDNICKYSKKISILEETNSRKIKKNNLQKRFFVKNKEKNHKNRLRFIKPGRRLIQNDLKRINRLKPGRRG